VPAEARPGPLVALYGPTSSGKTGLSVKAALRVERELGRPVVVISADSRQVYRYMDIGTSKTTAAEMRGIEHALIDVTEPSRKLELEDYVALARERIAAAAQAGALPFVVGGTGVYVSALTEGWEVGGAGTVRASLRRDFPPSMAADAHAMLRRLDRAAAARVHPSNYEAVLNALAAVMAGGEARRSAPESRVLVLGLDPGPRAVEQQVAQTYDDQVRRGLFGEVTDLAARYGLDEEARARGRDSRNQVLHTHGYREFFDLARRLGKPVAQLSPAELADVREAVLDHIRPHTRRQRTWFAKLPSPRMVTSPDHAFREIARAISARR
jgi:tRNA dimethylallyltransferase